MGNWSRSRLALMCIFTATVLHTLNIMSIGGGLKSWNGNRHADRAIQALLILALLAYGTATFISTATLFARSTSTTPTAGRTGGCYSALAILPLLGAIFTLVALSIFQNRYLKYLDDAELKVSYMGLSPVPYATAVYVIGMVVALLSFLLNLLIAISRPIDRGNIIYIPATQAAGAPEGTAYQAPPGDGCESQGDGAPVRLEVHPAHPGYQKPSPGPHRKGDGSTGLAEPAPAYIPRFGEQPND